MKLTYVSHACLLLEADGLRIAVDPWFNGAAYFNQWHVFPKPIDTSFVDNTDVVVLTHGHEDHLHPDTLKLFPRSAKVLFPYQWSHKSVSYLRELGFNDVTEAISFKSYQLTEHTSVTYVANGLDSITVFESHGKVLVNLNDALNAHAKAVIKLFVGEIKTRWNKIDCVVCGLGGAGYFPNNVYYEHKNDLEVAQLREEFLTYKFCELIEALQPETVVPFVPGFALLSDKKQWINKSRFNRERLPDFYKNIFAGTADVAFVPMMPGDMLDDDGAWQKKSPYHDLQINDNLAHLIPTMYADEMKAYNDVLLQPATVLDEIKVLIENILPYSSRVYNPELLHKVNFDIVCTDVDSDMRLRIAYDGAAGFNVFKTKPDAPPCDITLKTLSTMLRHSLTQDWGGDVFMIGYGADVHVNNPDALKDNMDIVCLRLLARFPVASETMVKEPLRAARYLFTNPKLSALAIRQKIRANGNPNKLPFNERDHWITKNKCEICRACDVPMLSEASVESL